MSDSTLKELWQQVAEKKNCEAKQKELTAQRDTVEQTAVRGQSATE